MPEASFSTGTDYAVRIVTQEGGDLRIANEFISNFDVQRESSTEKRRGIKGAPMSEEMPEGYSGSFNVDRYSPDLENFFIRLDQGYYQGVRQRPGSILESIREIDGSTSEYEYVGVKLSLRSLGQREQGKRVTMSLAFTAADRVQRV